MGAPSGGSSGTSTHQQQRRLWRQEVRDALVDYLIPGYWVGLALTSLWLPVTAAATLVWYVFNPKTLPPQQVLLSGTAIAIVLWLLAALVLAAFAQPGVAYNGVYEHLRNGWAQVASGADFLTSGQPETTTFTDDKVKLLSQRAPAYVDASATDPNPATRSSGTSATSATPVTSAGKAAMEVATNLARLDGMLRVPGLQWVLGQGYTNAWELLYRAEEAMMFVESDADLYLAALRDLDRLRGSTISGADRMQLDAKTALDTLFPAACAPRPSDVAKTNARGQLRNIKASINQFRIERIRGIVRARNLLLAVTLATELVLYAVMALAILMGAPPATVGTAVLFYLIGAGVGLLSTLLIQRNQATAVNDYGLSMSRSLLTSVPSGTAALGGVLVIVMLYGSLLGSYISAPAASAATASAATVAASAAPTTRVVAVATTLVATPTAAHGTTAVQSATPVASPGTTSSGTSTVAACPAVTAASVDTSRKLLCIYNIDADPYALLLAAVFGLAPAALINILQQQANRYVVDLKASEPSAGSSQD